jgi:hypothetical protein
MEPIMVFNKNERTDNPRKWSTIVILILMTFSTMAGEKIDDETYDPDPDTNTGGKGGGGTYTPPKYEESGECPIVDYDDSGLSYCERAHRKHYNTCYHPEDEDGGYRKRRGSGDSDGRIFIEDEDGGYWITQKEWRDREKKKKSCNSNYAACSEIPCHSRLSEYRACVRYEEELYRKERRTGRSGKDCYNCKNKTNAFDFLSAAVGPVSQLASVGLSSYFGYRGQKAKADAYLNSNKAWATASENNQRGCYAAMAGIQDYTDGVGDRLLGAQNGEMLDTCASMQGYAGMTNLSGNIFGTPGNSMTSNGYSPGFIHGMNGQYANGANAGLLAQLGISANLIGSGQIPGSAGLSNYPIHGNNGNAWGTYGNGSAWSNNGSWQGGQNWNNQNYNQNAGSIAGMQFAQERNVANNAGLVASRQSLFGSAQQANSAYYMSPQPTTTYYQPNPNVYQGNPSNYFQSAPLKFGAAFQANFNYNGSQPTYRYP